jgi:hypothetical protein
LSTSEEILDVFYSDIEQKTKIVTNKYGIEAFLPNNMVKGIDGFHIFDMYGGLHVDEIVCSDYKPREKQCQRPKI